MSILQRLRRLFRRHSALPACAGEGPDIPIMFVQRFLQPPPQPCDHPPGEGLHVWDEPLVINTPARGDAYDFVVTVWCTWCAQPKTFDPKPDLAAEINARRRGVERDIRNVIRATARQFLANLPHEAEEAVNKELAAAFFRPIHDCENATVKLTVQAWVGLSEELREQRREFYRKVMNRRDELEDTHIRVGTLRQQRDLWLGFLEECEENWRSRHAVKIPDGEAAKVIEDMERRREEAVDQFLKTLDKVIASQQQVNVFDLVKNSESALRVALRQLGVHVPEPSTRLPWEDA